MNNNIRIIIATIILIILVSTSFFVLPVNEKFITSYIFIIISIFGISSSLYVFNKYQTTKAPYGYSYIYTAITYSMLCVIFSIIACITRISLSWTIVLHIIILGVFAIRTIALLSGTEHSNRVNKSANDKHSNFVNEKKNYWN